MFTYVLFYEKKIVSYIDSLIFISNPEEKNGTHLTLRGPHEKFDPDEIKNDLTERTVSVLGAGGFFDDGQCTVFLKCDSGFIKKHWKKSDYGYNPHITIYDGKDMILAEKIYKLINRYNLYFSMTVSDVVVRKTIIGQKSFNLMFDIDLDGIKNIIGNEKDLNYIKNAEDWERLMLMDRICNNLKWEVSRRR